MHDPWAGMLSLECYGKWLLRELDLHSKPVLEVLKVAIPHALKQVVTLLRFNQIRPVDQEPPASFDSGWEAQSGDRWITSNEILGVESDRAGAAQPDELINHPYILDLVAYPFPKDSTIWRMMSCLLGCEDIGELRIQPSVKSVRDLPAVAEYVEKLKQSCECSKCGNRNGRFKSSQSELFIRAIANLATHILALSLFDNPQDRKIPLLVQQYHLHPQDALIDKVKAVITKGVPFVSSIGNLLSMALRLVGHPQAVGSLGVVMSSYKGQVVYPRIFETQQVDEPGYLVLSWAPGVLKYEREVFRIGLSGIYLNNHKDPVTHSDHNPVTIPCNLAKDMKVSWQVSRGEKSQFS